METPLFIMASPIIGRHEFSPHTVAGVDLSHVNAHAELPMDLILGYTTLRQAYWVFDFPRKRTAESIARQGVETAQKIARQGGGTVDSATT